jgi:dimethylaniline monooxygenase (N-oxide forming)
MRIAVIGAGPSGLTSAKQALVAGHEVVCYERHDDVGGIWNPAAGGAYASVRMQTSRMAFPFTDFAPGPGPDFLSLAEVHGYLRGYAEHFGVLGVIRFGSAVTRVRRANGRWEVTAGGRVESFDAVMVATGELWQPKRPARLPRSGARVLTAKDYRDPDPFRGRRVLVVGGGVSGADVAAELVGTAAAVDWSVRTRHLFLPRRCGEHVNDALFSYAGRIAVEDLPYQDFLGLLEKTLPDYLRGYRETGLLPEADFHGAVHINDRIIPLVGAGEVTVRPPFAAFAPDGAVRFADGGQDRYDSVVLCLGYEMPDYGFVDGLAREDLYEHHVHRLHPTLSVINTPVDGEGFGTACPYFEAIAGWVLAVLDGRAELPGPAERTRWCAEHLSDLGRKRYLDCWLETIRFRCAGGDLPDPATDFTGYWAVVSSVVAPDNLISHQVRPAACDDAVDLTGVRHRILAGLPAHTRDTLLATGQIAPADHLGAMAVPPDRALAATLPYRQRAEPVGKQCDIPAVEGKQCDIAFPQRFKVGS